MPRLPTEEEIAWMTAHADDTMVPDIIACTSITGVASVIFVALRVVSRKINGTSLQLSDYLILVAWVFYAVLDILLALSVKYGGGRHVILVTDARMLQIINLVNENVYMFAMAFIKFSILAMYAYIFPSKKFRWVIIAVAVFISMWAISAALVSTFQCLPIEFGWNPTLPGGSCINYGLLVLVAGILNVITDFVILAMPIPLVLKLQMSKQKKWLLIFTFAMGGSACIVSIVRLAYSLKVGSTANGSWDSMPAGMASAAELMVGILAASLPVYRPLWRRLVGKGNGRTTTDRSNGKSSLNENSNISKTSRTVNVTASGRIADDGLGGISVTDHILMQSYNRKGDGWIRVDDDKESQTTRPDGSAYSG